MYTPKEYELNDQKEIFRFIRGNSLGTLISQTQVPEPCISHLPFLLEEKGENPVFETHLSRNNPHLALLKDGANCTVVFQGPNTYISSSVYNHHNVPTWNYQAVHVMGKVEVMTGAELKIHLEKSIDFFEAKRHQALHFSDLNTNMVEGYLRQISGIRVLPYKFEAKYKLSQNRNETDFQAVVSDLESSPDLADKRVAEAMKNEKKRSRKEDQK